MKEEIPEQSMEADTVLDTLKRDFTLLLGKIYQEQESLIQSALDSVGEQVALAECGMISDMQARTLHAERQVTRVCCLIAGMMDWGLTIFSMSMHLMPQRLIIRMR
jgi:hypothetical protein